MNCARFHMLTGHWPENTTRPNRTLLVRVSASRLSMRSSMPERAAWTATEKDIASGLLEHRHLHFLNGFFFPFLSYHRHIVRGCNTYVRKIHRRTTPSSRASVYFLNNHDKGLMSSAQANFRSAQSPGARRQGYRAVSILWMTIPETSLWLTGPRRRLQVS